MKMLIGSDIGSVAFDPSAGTLTFDGVPELAQNQLLIVTNVTHGQMLYSFADPALGGTLVGNILTLTSDCSAMDPADAIQAFIDLPSGLEMNAQPTFDTNLADVLGSSSLLSGNRLRAENTHAERYAEGPLGALGAVVGIDCHGMSTATLQIPASPAWAGTVTFEASSDGGNFVPINGMTLTTNAAVSSSTTSNLWRFNVAGLVRIQARITAYTSGVALASWVASAESSVIVSAQTPYDPNATSNLSNINTATGSVNLVRQAAEPLAIAPSVPTIAAPVTTNFLGMQPQVYPRLRVEVGGDQKQPLAQDSLSKRILVAQPEMYSLLEQILLQIRLSNQLFMDANTITYPADWDVIH